MLLLGIESSCDETSSSVLRSKGNKLEILSNVISSSADFHAKTGGIIPEIAAREQIKFILPVIKKSLEDANLDFYKPKIDAIAVTIGPGLIGSLLIGVETAKTLSLVWNKPIIPVNHLIGHIYANFIKNPNISFPVVALVVSGAHTDLLLLESHTKIKLLGGTRDDAAGEAFDKIGRMLGLPYPAGPSIENLAKEGNRERFIFPKPLVYSKDFDFSFSGLKTAVFREIQKTKLDDQTIKDICFATQDAIIEVLIKKTTRAVRKYKAKSILLGGGVAANQALSSKIKENINEQSLKAKFYVPEKILCTDNGAMIAAAGFYHNKTESLEKIEANPSLYY
jgi:N6-L-threonylcarbamoyladenine synthase